MTGPLDQIRVVDCTSMISGPLATQILGDQGADVVKVEAPGSGDLVRHMGRGPAGMAPTFATVNRNKRSVVFNLRAPAGRALLERLVATADVFVQNFRPGTAERMGIGEEALRRVRPDLVYVSISGFGEKGPYANKRVYDPVVQALSGLAAIQADRDTGRPRMVRLIVPDKLTGVTAAQAITAALFSRERTGRGQHVRLSMLDAMVAFLWHEGMAAYTWKGHETKARPQLAQDLIFETRDGWMTAGTVSDAEWQGFARVTGHPEWLEDERFATAAGRVTHVEQRLELMTEALRGRTTKEWLALLDEADVPCAPVLSRADLLTHPQIAANELIVESEHPHGGPMRQPRPAARFDHTPATIRRAAPLLGEHTDELLRELGCAPGQIAAWRAEGVVA